MMPSGLYLQFPNKFLHGLKDHYHDIDVYTPKNRFELPTYRMVNEKKVYQMFSYHKKYDPVKHPSDQLELLRADWVIFENNKTIPYAESDNEMEHHP